MAPPGSPQSQQEQMPATGRCDWLVAPRRRFTLAMATGPVATGFATTAAAHLLSLLFRGRRIFARSLRGASIGLVVERGEQCGNISLGQVERRFAALANSASASAALRDFNSSIAPSIPSSDDELVDEHRLVLADAVGAVSCLVFDRRVPPGIIVDHRIGRREIEAGTAGLQAQEEQRHLTGLELADRRRSVDRIACQHHVRNFERRDPLLDQCQHAGELRE